ncbi:NlpC/P60 family protein [Actinoplanes sp. NPDC049118]|uniref:C40 family peptidase n=1 Tax=Actinoplanes sp. NPDC049118 TaxID=3155769 RepID=UPI0033D766BB
MAGTGTIALSLGLCLCAGQLVATPAASAAAPVVEAAAASAIKPKITNSATRSIAWGKAVRVTAKVIDPKTGKVVTKGSVRLQAKRDGKWRTWVTRKLSAKGTVTLAAEPHITGYFRTQYTGATGYSSVTSPGIKVTVRSSGAKVLAEARKHKGALYKFAAAGPKRFDCSGYTQYVFRKTTGKKLPHKANSQQKHGKKISKSKKRIGDLIVVRSGSYGTHAGIYAGNGYMWDSPHSGARVGKHKIWSNNYVVRRLAAA